MNERMRRSIAEARAMESTGSTADVSRLISLVWPDFYEVGGCVFLRTPRELSERDVAKHSGALSMLEYSHNETRIECYACGLRGGLVEEVGLAVKVAEAWECKLRRDYPNYSFGILVGFDEPAVTMRFYRLRKDEPEWIELVDSVEGYANGGLMIIHTGAGGC